MHAPITKIYGGFYVCVSRPRPAPTPPRAARAVRVNKKGRDGAMNNKCRASRSPRRASKVLIYIPSRRPRVRTPGHPSQQMRSRPCGPFFVRSPRPPPRPGKGSAQTSSGNRSEHLGPAAQKLQAEQARSYFGTRWATAAEDRPRLPLGADPPRAPIWQRRSPETPRGCPHEGPGVPAFFVTASAGVSRAGVSGEESLPQAGGCRKSAVGKSQLTHLHCQLSGPHRASTKRPRGRPHVQVLPV